MKKLIAKFITGGGSKVIGLTYEKRMALSVYIFIAINFRFNSLLSFKTDRQLLECNRCYRVLIGRCVRAIQIGI